MADSVSTIIVIVLLGVIALLLLNSCEGQTCQSVQNGNSAQSTCSRTP